MDERKERNPDDAVQSPPPGTPSWSLGLAFAATSFLSAFLGLYVAMSPDIRAYVSSQGEIRKQELTVAQQVGEKNNASVLQIVATYSSQVADLSKTMGILQQEKNDLGVKIGNLEREVDQIKGSYTTCAAQLEICRGRTRP